MWASVSISNLPGPVLRISAVLAAQGAGSPAPPPPLALESETEKQIIDSIWNVTSLGDLPPCKKIAIVTQHH